MSHSQLVVLFGGTSSERLVATASAQHVAAVCPESLFWFWCNSGEIVQVSREELLEHANPFKVELKPCAVSRRWPNVESALDYAASQSFVLFLSLHGGDGENGCLQKKLEARKIFFTGSGATASATAFDKELAKCKLMSSGITMAHAITMVSNSSADHLRAREFQKLHGNIVCKPQCDGSSVGLAFVDDIDGLEKWLANVGAENRQYILEQRIFGREFTVGVVDLGFGGRPMPVSEVVITNPGGAFDYDGKYLGRGTKEITPANITQAQQEVLQYVGLSAHTNLGCVGYSRTDVILNEKGAYFLETNTLPGLTRASFIPQQLAVAGISMRDFIDAQVSLARKRYN